MLDVVKILPDSVANQIAAGEVIQRPASAVKELLENAIDAGADSIQLIVKDAGKTLVQVVDNGSGMSETDARLCFERHATSKINKAGDLFHIRTMGFRGEALASIAAIARVELKTRQPDAEVGTEVLLEGTRLISQNPCNCPPGTSIAVKNLFYNTPARRNFLKSENVERRHILSEFQRVALANHDKSFQYYQNGKLTHQLHKEKLVQRIAHLFGGNYKQRIVPVSEETQIVNIRGYVGKPEYAKKTRGEQYLFVNNRFIRSPYLNHAVEQAFDELIPDDAFASFFLFLETDPELIDVNVHPTKTEIKFQDDTYIYQILKTSIRQALGKYNVSPALDFERETAFDDIPPPGKDRPVAIPTIRIDPEYNPFERQSGTPKPPSQDLRKRIDPSRWEQLYPTPADFPAKGDEGSGRQILISSDWDASRSGEESKKFFQLHLQYIVTPVKSGMMIIDQHRAHERVLYEKFAKNLEKSKPPSQQLLFPENIRLTENEAEMLRDIIDPVRQVGFGINTLQKNTFVIDAVPADITDEHSLQDVVEGIIENMRELPGDVRQNLQDNVLRSMARRLAIKRGKSLSEEEMASLTNSLFACDVPQYTPSGKAVLNIFTNEELSERFK